MIVLVIGPPASGKTSLCTDALGFRHVELDRLIPKEIDFSSNSYKEMRERVVRNVLETVTEPTIFDDTFHLFSMRKPFMKKAADMGVGFGIFQMPSQPLKEHLQRNEKRSERIPDASLIRIYESFEPLRPSERRHEVRDFTQALLVPFKKAGAPNNTSALHKFDLELRKVVNQFIPVLPSKDEHFIQEILEERRNTLLAASESGKEDIKELLMNFTTWLNAEVQKVKTFY